MSPNDILLYFAAETTAVQVLRFKQTYLCGIPDLAHQLINFRFAFGLVVWFFFRSMLQNFGEYR